MNSRAPGLAAEAGIRLARAAATVERKKSRREVRRKILMPSGKAQDELAIEIDRRLHFREIDEFNRAMGVID